MVVIHVSYNNYNGEQFNCISFLSGPYSGSYNSIPGNNDTILIELFNESVSLFQWIGVYGGLTGAVIVFTFTRVLLFFLLLLRASRLLHNKMFGAVLRAPVHFFDTNPVGRVTTSIYSW